MIAIVCGSRTYDNEARVKTVLDAAVTKLGLNFIIEGECPTPVNADKLARKWAEERGDITVVGVEASTVDGKFQGPARNQMMAAMLMRSDDDKACIAFPPGEGTRGTRHMVGVCEGLNATQNANIRIIKIDW